MTDSDIDAPITGSKAWKLAERAYDEHERTHAHECPWSLASQWANPGRPTGPCTCTHHYDDHIWAWRIDRLYTLRPRLCRWLNGDAGLIVGYGSGLTYSAWMVPNTDEA